MRKLFKSQGVALLELVVSCSVSVVLIGIGLIASISIQRCFNASMLYAKSQAQQSRVLDYMALDLRRSTTVGSEGSGSARVLKLTIPDYYDAAGQPRTPVIQGGMPKYSPTDVNIRYYLSGSQMMRSVNGVATPIADRVEDFLFTDPKLIDQLIQIELTFAPTFQKNNGNQTTRDGTKSVIRILLRNKIA